jgi:hypothetical protein
MACGDSVAYLTAPSPTLPRFAGEGATAPLRLKVSAYARFAGEGAPALRLGGLSSDERQPFNSSVVVEASARACMASRGSVLASTQ